MQRRRARSSTVVRHAGGRACARRRTAAAQEDGGRGRRLHRRPEHDVQAIGPMFEKKTGIKVSFVEAGTGEILKRARAEAANPLGDVLLGARRRSGHGGQRRPPGALHGGRRRPDRRHLQEGDGRRPHHAEQRDADGHRPQHEAPARRGGAEDLAEPRRPPLEGPDRLRGRRQVGLLVHDPGDPPHGVRRQRRRLEGRRGHHEEREDSSLVEPCPEGSRRRRVPGGPHLRGRCHAPGQGRCADGGHLSAGRHLHPARRQRDPQGGEASEGGAARSWTTPSRRK